MHLHMNCTKKDDFLAQAEKIGHKFINKGYNSDHIKARIQELEKIDWFELIKDKRKKQDSRINVAPIVLDYNAQHKNVEKIIKWHWHILLTDTHLKSLHPQIPKFVYKRAPTLRDKIVKNIPDPPTIGYTFFIGKGFYPCKLCFACTN